MPEDSPFDLSQMKGSLRRAEIDDYIETFYNRIRRHSHLSEVSPEAFEAMLKQA